MPGQPDTFFVGRELELSLLRTAIASAAGGTGRVLAISGEPGIGKSTLAARAMAEASDAGWVVLEGCAFEGGLTPPFWIWTQIVRAALASKHAKAALVEMAARQRDIVSIMVEASVQFGARHGTGPPAEETTQFDVLDSVSQLLRAISRLDPVMIMIDDLQWADETDLLAFQFVAQQVRTERVLITGLYREADSGPGNPLAETVGAVTRLHGFQTIHLGPMDSRDVSRIIEDHSPARLTGSRLAELTDRAEGNPLFGRELAFARTGELVPPSLRSAIDRRLQSFDPNVLDMFSCAALIAVEFSTGELRESSGVAHRDVTEALQIGESAGIVQPVRQDDSVYKISHPLIRETLVRRLDAADRTKQHAAIALALIRLYGEADPAHASAIARHGRTAIDHLNRAQVIRIVGQAASNASASFAFAESVDHLTWLLDQPELRQPIYERAELLYQLAVSKLRSDRDKQQGWDRLAEAVRLFIDLERNDRAVEAASFPAPLGGIDGSLEVIKGALKVAVPGTPERGWLVARQIAALVDEGEFDDAEIAYGEAVETARRSGDRKLEARLLAHGGQAGYRSNSPATCVERGLKAISIGLEFNEALTVARILEFCCESLCSIQQTDVARQTVDRCRALARQTRDPGLAIEIRNIDYLTDFCTGRWEGVDSYVRWSRDQGRHAPWFDWLDAHTRLRIGKRDRELEGLLQPEFSKWRLDAYHVAVDIASTWLQVDADPVYLRLCEQVLTDAVSQPRPSTEGDVRRAALRVLIRTAKGQRPTDDDVEFLERSPGLNVPRSSVPIARILGIVALSEGNLTQANHYAELSIESCRKAEFMPALAWSCLDLLRIASFDRSQVPEERIAEVAREALRLCDDLAMPALATLIRQERNKLRHGKSDRRPAGLSKREMEVLQLLAIGESNAEIAERLFISRHTVVRHTTNIYSKIGVSTRAEAAAYAERHDLVG